MPLWSRHHKALIRSRPTRGERIEIVSTRDYFNGVIGVSPHTGRED